MSVSAFADQIREAFLRCGPIPVFSVTNQGGQFNATHIKRIHTDVVPSIWEPKVRMKQLMDCDFQDEVNESLGSRPICFDGVDDLAFKLKTGKYAVIRGIRWSYEINRIDRMEMDRTGTVGIMEYQFTHNLFGG